MRHHSDSFDAAAAISILWDFRRWFKVGLPISSALWAAFPKTFDDWLGWILAVTLYLLVLGLVLLVFGLTTKLWREIWGASSATLFIYLFNLFTKTSPTPLVPMLLICGDEDFCEADEAQLQRARISFRKLDNATLGDLERELQRRRIDGTLYTWVHIAAHGNRQGFALGNNEMITTEWLVDHFEGIKVVFAASCDSVDAGDALAGIVDATIVVYGKRGSGLISTFACVFWREMAESNNVRRAYQTALREVPQLRPFVDLRTR